MISEDPFDSTLLNFNNSKDSMNELQEEVMNLPFTDPDSNSFAEMFDNQPAQPWFNWLIPLIQTFHYM